ncbi:MAG: hypothetical protein EOM12_03420 [Verrucomicrobiae bacterium]|nr:hypothetical protein [Verrucomicrobiae bacterium]
MNPKKTNAISETEARKIAGDAVDEVLGKNCDFTGRLIDECYGVTEMSATVPFVDQSGEDRTITCLYLIDNEQLAYSDDLSELDYSVYTFVID